MYESCIYMREQNKRRNHLNELIQLFLSEMNQTTDFTASNHLSSPIQSIVIPGSQQVTEAAHILQKQGFDVRPMRPPTVAKGQERLRIILHSHNSKAEVLSLVSSIKRIKAKFGII